MTRLALAFAACLAAAPAAADEVTDAISNALDAYQQGDVAYAMDELTFALQLLNEMKAGTLTGFLPAPLDGWTREVSDDMSTGLGMAGGGVGAEATYEKGSDRFTIMLMADNPMVAAMAGMLGNAAMMTASGGRMVRVGREKFVQQDDQLMALIGNRVLVQAEGDDAEAMIAHLETIDFRALAAFGP